MIEHCRTNSQFVEETKKMMINASENVYQAVAVILEKCKADEMENITDEMTELLLQKYDEVAMKKPKAHISDIESYEGNGDGLGKWTWNIRFTMPLYEFADDAVKEIIEKYPTAVFVTEYKDSEAHLFTRRDNAGEKTVNAPKPVFT